jgi:predicted dehydrogenase
MKSSPASTTTEARVSTSSCRWGIIGTGTVARAFAEDLRHLPDASIVSICSRSADRARQFATEHGATYAYGSREEFLNGNEVDVVYVATPHPRHKTDCEMCLDAGRGVLCEKPFTVNAFEAGSVIRKARDKHLFCMEAMWMRFQPLILQVRSMIQSGAIGRVRLLTADFGYPAPFHPENRFFSRELGGGALLDRGVYLLSLASFLLGQPTETTGRAVIGATGVDEQVSILSIHPEGSTAVMNASLRSRLRNEAIIVGTEGEIRIHEPFFSPHRISWKQSKEPESLTATPVVAMRSRLAWLKGNPIVRRLVDQIGRPTWNLIHPESSKIERYDQGHGYRHEAAEVMRCLRQGLLESPIMPLDESLTILETADALRRSWSLSYPGESD